MNKSTATYYLGRIVQRVALCLAVGSTIIHWIVLIVITGNVEFAHSLDNSKFKDSNALTDDLHQIINTQSMIVLRWVVIAGVVTALILLIRRFRKYEKPLFIDSAVLLVFCLLSVVFSQLIVKTFLTRVFG